VLRRSVQGAHQAAENATLVHMTKEESQVGGSNRKQETPVSGQTSSQDEVAFVDSPHFDRPLRRRLVPSWIPIAAAGMILVVAVVVVVAILVARGDRVSVPDVVGMNQGDALAVIAQSGLRGEVGETRFDLQPSGTVLEQDPSPDTMLERDSIVSIVVSAGAEQFAMPDVVGESLSLARARLETLGLIVEVEYVEDATVPKDTVLYTNPLQGATVRTSDRVLLAVAAEPGSTPTLMPFDLTGVHIVLDPTPPPDGSTDVTLKSSLRLQSLLEASGADVTVTRTGSEEDVSDGARANRAEESTGAILAIGMTIAESGPGGARVVTVVSERTSSARQTSEAVAAEIANLLSADGRAVTSEVAEADAVLGDLPMAVVRVGLGSLADEEDASLLRDPTYSDRIAEKLYRAIGEKLGTPR